MTWYVKIDSPHEPFDMGLDASGRSLVGFNVNIEKRDSDSLPRELLALVSGIVPLVAGVTIPAIVFLVGARATIPNGPGPFLTITPTAGTSAKQMQNKLLVAEGDVTRFKSYTRPSAQIVARALNYEVAYATAKAAYNKLVVVRNLNVTPV